MGKRKNLEIGPLFGDKHWVEQVRRYLPLDMNDKLAGQTFITIFSVVTVRGMMYYREALKLQAFLDIAEDEGQEHWILVIVSTVFFLGVGLAFE